MPITIIKSAVNISFFLKDLSFFLNYHCLRKRVKSPKQDTHTEPKAVKMHVNASEEPCTGYPLSVNIHKSNSSAG